MEERLKTWRKKTRKLYPNAEQCFQDVKDLSFLLEKAKKDLEEKESELDQVRLQELSISLKKAREMKLLRLELENQINKKVKF